MAREWSRGLADPGIRDYLACPPAARRCASGCASSGRPSAQLGARQRARLREHADAVSDAREMAFLWSGQNSVGDLYVQLIRSDRADEKPLRLTHTENGFLCCQSWSPDG